jgi:hypothetical protein
VHVGKTLFIIKTKKSMKSYSIRVSKIDREDAFKELALEVGGELEESNTLIRFSGEMGRGRIKKYHLDAGLYMRVWDLFLLKPVEIVKEALPVYITDNGFGLLCIQTPESAIQKGARTAVCAGPRIGKWGAAITSSTSCSVY